VARPTRHAQLRPIPRYTTEPQHTYHPENAVIRFYFNLAPNPVKSR
jgi:hypothetical protein